MRLGLQVQDADAKAKLKAARKRGKDAMRAATFMRAQDLMDAALRLVPVRTGALRDSRYVKRSWPVRAAFGLRYAAPVHERHAVHGVGQRKFLELPLLRLTGEGTSTLTRYFQTAWDNQWTLRNAPHRHPLRPGRTVRRGRSARPKAGR